MKHMFAGDPWYNTQGQQHGVQGMGFRPGPVQVAIVRQMQPVAPTFGQIPTASIQAQAPLVQQPYVQQAPAPGPQAQPQQPAPGRIPMGTKTDCPVCRTFGGR